MPPRSGVAQDDDPAAAFLAALDPDATAWTFQTFDDDKARAAAYRKAHKHADPKLTRILSGSLTRCRAELLRLNARGAGIFVTVNRTDLKGRKIENIISVRALFLDLDGAPLEPVRQHATPHIVIESSPGRFQVHWRVDNVKLDQFEGFQEALIAHFSGDPKVTDLSRVMRLPGFAHQKGEPFVSRIVEINDLPPYSAADIVPPPEEPSEDPQPEAGDTNGADPGGDSSFWQAHADRWVSFFRGVNDLALARADQWVPVAFPGASKNSSGQWRVPPGAMGRDCEEDLSISPTGIKDFGIHDMGDARGGRRTAIDLVMDYAHLSNTPADAALWLCEQMAIDPADLGWRGAGSFRPGGWPGGGGGGASQGGHAGASQQGGQTSASQQAEPPRPLSRELPDPEPFPVAALGGVLGNAAQAIHDRVQVPMAIGAQSVLAAATLAVQGFADIELPIGRGSRRPISDFFISIAFSGDRKTEADRQATWAVSKREAALRERYEAAMPGYRNQKLAWDRARDAAARTRKDDYAAIRAALDVIGPEPRAPLEPMLTCPEPTFEGLCKLFAVGHPSLGIFSSEGGQFIGGHGLSDDKKLMTVCGLSDTWDGTPIRRVRAGDGATVLPGRRLALHLMVQPGVAATLLCDDTLADQGLLSRLLIAAPTSLAGTRFWREEQPETDRAIRRYGGRLLTILETRLPLRPDTVNELAPRAITLSLDARAMWTKFVDHIERQIVVGGEFEPVRDLANKLAEHAARLGAVLALIENLDAGEVTAADIEAGIALAEHYAGEALRLRGAARVGSDLLLTQKLLNWLLTSWSEPAISLPAIYQLGPNAVRDKATAAKLINILEDHGWLARIIGGAEVAGQQRREAWRIVRG